MTILWVHRADFDEGLDRTTWLDMINELKTLGQNVSLLTSYRREKLDYGLGRNLIYVPQINVKVLRALSFLIFSYFRIIWYIITQKPHIVILDIWTFWCGFPLDVFSKLGLIKTKFVIDMRTFYYGVNSDKYSPKDFLIKLYTDLGLAYNKYIHAGLSVITKELKRQVQLKYKIPENSICVWSSGVSLEKFKLDVSKKKLDLKGKFVVMQHGGFSYNRGLHETILAIDLLKVRYPDIILFLLGSGPAENILKKTIHKLILQKRCILHQPVNHNEIPQYLANCDVGILAYPSIKYWQLNNPIKLLEYLAMSKPVIVTDMPAFRDVIGLKKCGIFTKSNRPSDIARAIAFCYKNKEKLNEWGMYGREITEQKYTWKRQARVLADFLSKLTRC